MSRACPARLLFLAILTAATAWSSGPALAQGGGPTIALDVSGPQANPDKLQRCLRVAQKSGYVVNPSAPLRVMLILQPGTNRLQITSARRGEVYNQPKPGWGMEQLCQDAIQTAGQALAHEGDPPVTQPAPVGNYAPPPPPPQRSVYVPPPGSPPTIALDVVGPASNSGKVERCQRVAQQRGFAVHPQAGVRVMLILASGTNRLQITSARRGEVYNQPKPGWGMEQLCQDAMTTATQMLAQEGNPPVGGAPPPGYGAPRVSPPSGRRTALALGPIPPSTTLPAPSKAAADGAVTAWQAARFDQALAGFREANRLHNDSQFLFDQAVCEQRLGRYTEALAHTQQFIDVAPQSPYRPYAEQLFGELQSQLGNE